MQGNISGSENKDEKADHQDNAARPDGLDPFALVEKKNPHRQGNRDFDLFDGLHVSGRGAYIPESAKDGGGCAEKAEGEEAAQILGDDRQMAGRFLNYQGEDQQGGEDVIGQSAKERVTQLDRFLEKENGRGDGQGGKEGVAHTLFPQEKDNGFSQRKAGPAHIEEVNTEKADQDAGGSTRSNGFMQEEDPEDGQKNDLELPDGHRDRDLPVLERFG